MIAHDFQNCEWRQQAAAAARPVTPVTAQTGNHGRGGAGARGGAVAWARQVARCV